MESARRFRRAYQSRKQTVHASGRVAHSMLALYPIHDHATRPEPATPNLTYQPPFLWNVGVAITVTADDDADSENGTAGIHNTVYYELYADLSNPAGCVDDPDDTGVTAYITATEARQRLGQRAPAAIGGAGGTSKSGSARHGWSVAWRSCAAANRATMRQTPGTSLTEPRVGYRIAMGGTGES